MFGWLTKRWAIVSEDSLDMAVEAFGLITPLIRKFGLRKIEGLIEGTYDIVPTKKVAP